MITKNEIIFNDDFFTYKIRKDPDAITLKAMVPRAKPGTSLESFYIGELTVPETGEKITITRIGRKCFKAGSGPVTIGTLVIEDSVKFITHAAFAEAPVDIVIWPSTCRSIPKKCFTGSKVKKILNTDNVDTIGVGAFKDCSFLESFHWPNKCKIIPIQAFSGCCSLFSVDGTESVESIEEFAFFGTLNLSKIELSSVIQIKKSAFQDSGILRIAMSNFLTSIEDRAFMGSSLLNIAIPDSVTLIGKEAFKNCKSLCSVRWSESCCVIAPATFNKCTELVSITNIENVHKIGKYAFASCGIADFSIPNEVRVIEYGVFSECRNLSYIHNIHNIAIIEPYAFSMSSLAEIAIPPCQIGEGALQGCVSLRKVYLTGENIVIPEHFCENCIHLKGISGIENIIGIKKYAFAHTDLRKMDFSELSLEFVEKGAFVGTNEIDFTPSFWTEVSKQAFS